MSHGPMVSAASLLRIKRERDKVESILLMLLMALARANARPPAQVRKRAPMFDYKMRQAGERDE